jgi:hypothetical protein
MATGIMNRQRKLVVTVTVGFFVSEWLLFELIRLPYRPPNDMTTFLGVEKYAVMNFMVAMILPWAGMVGYCLVGRSFTYLDFAVFVGLVFALVICVGLAFIYPPWVVSPWELTLEGVTDLPVGRPGVRF